MCGIWALLMKDSFVDWDYYKGFNRISNRGPDRSNLLELHKEEVKIGFHRLAIKGLSRLGDQPFTLEIEDSVIYVICNGEIYNYKELAEEWNIKLKTGSDCEIIPYIYKLKGIDYLNKHLLGEYAFIIIECMKKTNDISVHISRDPYGVRPLFYTINDNNICFASEPKGLNILSKTIKEFPPGHYAYLNKTNKTWSTIDFIKYRHIENIKETEFGLEKIKYNIVPLLTEAVRCRLDSDVPIGCLLSGGLDSSLVSAIASKLLKSKGKRLRTFSIGMENSTDEKYAKIVAKYIDSDHTHIDIGGPEEWLKFLNEIIYKTCTYDITTIRASFGQILASKWIKQNTDIKVLLIGDGSDELTSGYMYFHNAPSPEESHNENIRLLNSISKYDVLRSDRGISSSGLEARVPFLDIRFTEYYLSIDHKLRIPLHGKEKWLLRESFVDTGYLPQEVLFRKKEAFSDGVSGTKKSWSKCIEEYTDKIYTDKHVEENNFLQLRPYTKESLHYRTIFNKYYPNFESLLSEFWLPKWCGNVTDPSARVLEVYNE